MIIEKRIYKELLHEPAIIWFINDDFGAKVIYELNKIITLSI